MLKIASEYVFNVMGDGVDDSMIIPLRALKAPDPITSNVIPSAFVEAQVGPSPGGATAELQDGEYVKIVFEVAPPANAFTKVTLTALFGTERD
jgi:hypothetical protein